MQQVNLYQPILRKQEKVFSAKTLLQGNLLVLLGLLLLFAYTAVQTSEMKGQLTQVQRERDGHIQQLAELAKQYPPKQKDATLKTQIEQAEQALQHKRRLLAAVQEMGLDRQGGFSSHMMALSRQDMPQLWLRHIMLRQGRQAQLLGSAQQADAVALYLQRLATESAFNGTTFHQVEIARNEEHAGQVDFTLSTEKAEAEK